MGLLINSDAYLGYEFEKNILNSELGDDEIKEMRNRCISFVLKLIKELQNRLPSNINIFSKIEMLSVERVLCHLKDDITNITKMFVNDDDTIEKIKNEWSNIHLIKWQNTTDTFWNEVYSFRNAANENSFKNLVANWTWYF